MNHNPQSICIIRLTSLGDIVLLSPLIRVLRNKWPNARIDMIISEHCSEIMQYNPHIDNLHVINTKKGTAFFLKQWFTLKQLLPTFDVVLDVHCSLRSRIIRQGLGKTILTYDPARALKRDVVKNKTRLPFASIIPVPARYFTVFRGYEDISIDDEGLECWLQQDLEQKVYPKNRVQLGQNIVLVPGAKHATKRWPPEYFATLIQQLHLSYQQPIVLLGGPDDAELCSIIEKLTPIPIQNLAGTMSLHEIIAYMDTATCIIGNDSGLMHIAASRHIPIVTIFGSTVPEFGFLPYHTPFQIASIELPCKPCTHIGKEKCPLGHFSCMKDVSPEFVFNKVQTLLHQSANMY